jgi:hypothetical protein
MKKPVLVALIIALVCTMAFLGCKSDDGGSSGGGGGASGLSLPVNVAPSALPDLPATVTTIVTEAEAKTFMTAIASDLLAALSTANTAVYENAMYTEVTKDTTITASDYAGIVADAVFKVKKSVNYTVTLADADGAAAGSEGELTTALDGTALDSKATIKGSVKYQWDSTQTVAAAPTFDIEGTSAVAADFQTTQGNYNKEFAFGVVTDAEYTEIDISGTKYYVAGIIFVEGDGYNDERLEAIKGTDVAAKVKTSSNGTDKLTVALAIYSGTKGGKILFEYATTSNNGDNRTINNTSTTLYSDVVVYDSTNAKKLTIKNADATSIINLYLSVAVGNGLGLGW